MRLPRLCRFLARRLVEPKRPPDFIIGGADNPYMRRWFLIRRNRLCNIYLHNIRRSDDDRALHDHPWVSMSFCLKGAMHEMTPDGVRLVTRGDVVFRRAKSAHRLILGGGVECWTLFITGPTIRSWGFHCPQGWRHWRDFVASSDTGSVGRGCDGDL